MSDIWLPGGAIVNLSATHGYGPFTEPFLGVVAHVNQSTGNLANFFATSTDVCPNFQVYQDGTWEQYLPLDWQPWCQTAGNQQYAAIETEGVNTDPWTAAQISTITMILAAYRDRMAMIPQLADAPGHAGFGWHGMGGNAWGGHPNCPGEPRKAQRATVLADLYQYYPLGGGAQLTPGDDIMQFELIQVNAGAGVPAPAVGIWAHNLNGMWFHCPDLNYVAGLQADPNYKGLRVISYTQWSIYQSLADSAVNGPNGVHVAAH